MLEALLILSTALTVMAHSQPLPRAEALPTTLTPSPTLAEFGESF